MRFHNDQNQPLRLDATDFVWFKRELENVETEQYKILFPENQARALIPSQPGIPDWADAHVWREYEGTGKAKFIGSAADDLPRVDVLGRENIKMIRDVGDCYGWTIKEIKRSIATGRRLDEMRAAQARYAIETLVDEVLWLGFPALGLDGLLKLDTVGSIVPIVATTKTGGGTNWTAAATPDQIAADVFKLIAATIEKGRMAGGRLFRRFRVIMPDANMALLSTRRLGDGSDSKIFDFVRSSEYIESINAVWRATGAAANGVDDRIAIYPPDRSVLAAIVPQEFTPQEPEKRNLEYVVDCTGSTGGVLLRYAFAVGYMDAVDVV